MGNPILDFFIGKGGDLIKTVADKIGMDKAQAAQFQLDFQKEAQAMDMAELESAKAIMLAEANSTDKWTSRARPSFMYVMYLMILTAIPYGVWYAIHPQSAVSAASGVNAWLKAIPDGMWATFGLAFTGYTVGRSMEKVADIKHVQSKK